jgi:renalase
MDSISAFMTCSPKINDSQDNESLSDYFTCDVIVVGAGMSGLTVASELKASGVGVGVLEKARGTGGRLCSKRLTVALPEAHDGKILNVDSNASFDLGASVFQAKTSEFKQYLQELILQGVVVKTNELNSCDHNRRADMKMNSHMEDDSYVAVPRNSMLTRHMSRELNVTFGKNISRIELKNGKWYLFSISQTNNASETEDDSKIEDVVACCRHLVLSAPAEQAHLLLPQDHAALSWLRNINSNPVFVSSVILNANTLSPEILNTIKKFSNNVIDNISIEHMKAERQQDAYQIIKLTTTIEWSLQHLEEDLTDIGFELQQDFYQLLTKLNVSEVSILKQYTHRWLYSQYSSLIGSTKGYLSFSDNLHLVGDYFDVDNETIKHVHGKKLKGVERAYISGRRLVNHLLDMGAFNQAPSKTRIPNNYE